MEERARTAADAVRMVRTREERALKCGGHDTTSPLRDTVFHFICMQPWSVLLLRISAQLRTFLFDVLCDVFNSNILW